MQGLNGFAPQCVLPMARGLGTACPQRVLRSMGNLCCRGCCHRPEPDDIFSSEPLVEGSHPLPGMDNSFVKAATTPGFLMFSTRLSEGNAAYRVDLQPPYALRSANGFLVARLERIRSREEPHLLVLHGKADEFSTANAQDYARYYRIKIGSTAMLTDSGVQWGLRFVGMMQAGIRTDYSNAALLLNPPGLYPAEAGLTEQAKILGRGTSPQARAVRAQAHKQYQHGGVPDGLHYA